MSVKKRNDTEVVQDVQKEAPKSAPLHLEKYLTLQQHSFLESAFIKSKFDKTEMHTHEEWDSLIKKELTRDLK